MIFPFEVKKNGIYYPAGAEVPIGGKKGTKKSPSETPGKVDAKASETIVSKEEPVEVRKYSEEDLDLPYMKLKSLAKQEGFKVDKSAKAEEIKELLRTL